jgi:hypothetical protein
MTWQSIFIHEFLDSQLSNVLGAEGRIIASSPPPTVSAPSSTTRRGTTIRPGAWFGYELDRPRQEVIGMDIFCDVLAPVSGPGAVLPLASIEGAIALVLIFNDPVSTELIDGQLVAHARLTAKIGNQNVNSDTVRIPFRSPVTMQVNWHTSGQVRLFLNGELIAYEPQIMPDNQFTVARIIIGDRFAAASQQPRFFIQHVSIKILREDVSVTQILEQFPVEYPEEFDDERCETIARDYVKNSMSVIRQFMRLFVSSTTSSWKKSEQTPIPSFESAAIEAHERAVNAFTSFMRFILEGDLAARADYLLHLEKFLTLLRNELPGEYAQMLADLDAIEKPSPECLELGRRHLEANGEALQPLLSLADETIEIAHNIA